MKKIYPFILSVSLFLALSTVLGGRPAQQPQHQEPEHMERAYEIAVKFGDLNGEMIEGFHKGWCQVMGYRTSLAPAKGAAVTARLAKTGAAERPLFTLTVIKHLDKASPKLRETLIKRKTLDKVLMHLIARHGQRQVFMKYEMNNVRVISIATDTQKEGGHFRPVEFIQLQFEDRILWSFSELDQFGKSQGNVQAEWRKY